MQYKEYTVQDFVLDKSFRAWVFNPSEESDEFWHNWLKELPEKTSIIIEARKIVLNLTFDEFQMPESEKMNLWSKIDERINVEVADTDLRQQYYVFPQKAGKAHSWLKLKVAASVLLVLGLASWLLYASISGNATDQLSLTTDFGQTKYLTLDDGTNVILNANSQIEFDKHWTLGESREVWLNGEAYFDVTHTDDHSAFIVHTNNADVDVLGTEFNVYDRGDEVRVTLDEGSVRFRANNDKSRVEMQPGEIVLYSPVTKELKKSDMLTESYASWNNNRLVFNKMSLASIGELIKESYNLDLIFIDNDLADKIFNGSVPYGDIDLLIKSLEIAFDLTIEREDNVLVVGEKDSLK